MASNRKTGTTFESELCEILSQNGFWAHNLAQNSAGQPADVIAVRNKTAYLIDCKVSPVSERVQCTDATHVRIYRAIANMLK